MCKRHLFFAIAALTIAAAFGQTAEAQMDMLPSLMPFHFDSQPPLTAQAGVPYNYTVHLFVKDSTAIVRYRVDRLDPLGFSIDSASGVVTWTPAARGWYSISITAVVAYTTHALVVGIQQRFVVAVSGGNGIVQGKVTDTTNTGIPNVVVEVLQVSGPSVTSIPLDGFYVYTARTDNNGNYRIPRIDPGSYKLHAISPSRQYESQWYDGKATATEANKIPVADSPAVTIVNFTLSGGAARKPKITVSGIVTDSGMVPLNSSHVFFVRAGFAFNSNMTVDDYRQFFDMHEAGDDFRIEGNSAEVFQSKVDSAGNYSLQLPKGTYIAFAKDPGYGTVFYPGQSDMLSAAALVLLKDSSGINFALPKIPSIALGTIEGSVLDSALDIGVPSRIIATRDRWTTTDIVFGEPRSYVADTDSLGSFTVGNLLPGSYFVFAVPLGSYAPAYYTTDTISTWWRRATKVVISGNTATGINIYVHEIPTSVDGFATISGNLNLMGQISTVTGAVVYAFKGNVVAGFGITDVKGNYTVSGLAPGIYSLSVDRFGYVVGSGPSSSVYGSSTGTVSYDESGNPVNAVVSLSLAPLAIVNLVGEATALQPVQYALEQNYPNPFNPSTTIRYTLPASGRVAVRVYNILGQEVAMLVDGNQNAGSYEVSFNASALSSGVYFYRIESGSFEAVKKMMLLK